MAGATGRLEQFMKLTSRFFGVLLVGTLAAVTAWSDDLARPAKGHVDLDALFPDAVIVKAKNFQIKRARFDEDIIRVKTSAGFTGATPPAIVRQVLDNLIINQILMGKATESEKAYATREAEKNLESIKKTAVSEDVLIRQLGAMNFTIDKLRERLSEDATAEAVLHKRLNVTDDQIKKYYDEHPAKFEEPEMARVNHLLMGFVDLKTGAPLSDADKAAKLKLMQDIVKRARAGEDFKKLADQYTEDSSGKQMGSELKFPRGLPKVPLEFESAAFSLKPGQVSDVVVSQVGYHVIKLIEIIPAKKLAFDAEKDIIRKYLERMETEKIKQDDYEKLKKEAGVEILDPQLRDIENEPTLAPKTPPDITVK